MTQDDKGQSQIGAIFVGGGIAVLAFAIMVIGFMFNNQATQWFGLVSDWVKYEAVQGCMEVGTEEYSGSYSSSKAVIPNKEAYQECMKEKGL